MRNRMASELKQQLTRFAAVAVLLSVGVAAFGTIFTAPGYLIAGGIGVAAGLTLAAIWMPKFVFPFALVLTVLLLGPLATHRTDRPDSMVPTPHNVWEFVVLSAAAFKRILTINLTEITAQFGMLAVPYLTAFVAAVLAGFALRGHHFGLALLAACAPLIIAISVGTTRTSNAAILGAAFGVAAIVFLAVKSTGYGHGFLWRATRFVAATAVLAVAAGAGLMAAPFLTGENRELIREYVPQDLKPYEYATPLAKFRYYRTDLQNTTLLTVEGIPVGERIRVATMDYYDGTEYHVAGSDDPRKISGVFGPYTSARAGSEEATANLPQGNFVDAHIDIEAYRDVWFPGPARINWLTCSGPRMQDILDGLYFNQATGTAMTTVGLRRGDNYNVGGTLAVIPTEQQLATAVFAPIELPPDEIPAEIADIAARITAAAPRPIDKVLALQGFLQQGGFYNGGSTVMPVGHDRDRIISFLTAAQIVGDDEQYAVAMALMAKSVGIPTRVVAGFQVAPDRKTITGDDARAWVEIAFENLGWVQFDPAPPRDKVPPAPPSPVAPPNLPPPDEKDEEEKEPEEKKPPVQQAIDDIKESLPSAFLPLWNALSVFAKSLLILAIPLALALIIVAIKTRRRRRRQSLPDPSQRVSAGWHEAVDIAIDLGLARKAGATRLETAYQAQSVLPADGMVPLARLADADSFSPPVPDDKTAEEYWAAVDTWRDEVRSAVPRTEWWARAVSIRSLTSARNPGRDWSIPTSPWTSRTAAYLTDLVLCIGLFIGPLAAAANEHTGWRVAGWLAVGVVFVLFNLLRTAEIGQSIGKHLFNVRTELCESHKHARTSLNVRVALARVVTHALLNVFLFAGAWSVLLRPDRRGWHDLLTGTRVVTVEERNQQ